MASPIKCIDVEFNFKPMSGYRDVLIGQWAIMRWILDIAICWQCIQSASESWSDYPVLLNEKTRFLCFVINLILSFSHLVSLTWCFVCLLCWCWCFVERQYYYKLASVLLIETIYWEIKYLYYWHGMTIHFYKQLIARRKYLWVNDWLTEWK